MSLISGDHRAVDELTSPSNFHVFQYLVHFSTAVIFHIFIPPQSYCRGVMRFKAIAMEMNVIVIHSGECCIEGIAVLELCLVKLGHKD